MAEQDALLCVIVPHVSPYMRQWHDLARSVRGSLEGVEVAVQHFETAHSALRQQVHVDAAVGRAFLVIARQDRAPGLAAIVPLIMPGVTVVPFQAGAR